MNDIPSFDFDEVRSHSPADFIAGYRDKAPVLWLISDKPENNVMMVMAPEDIRTVLTSPERFSSINHPQSRRFDSDYDTKTSAIYAEHGLSLKNIAVWSDGAYHARVRSLIQTAFSPVRVAAKSPHIQSIIDDLLIPFAGAAQVEFVEAYANRLTTRVVLREFGLNESDFALVREVTDKVSIMCDTLAPQNSGEIAAPSIVRLQLLLNDRLNNIERLPETSLLRDLSVAHVDGEVALSREELLWLATLILSAGGHTTAAMLTWCVYMLASDRELQERLRRQPEKIEVFVEETLRLHGPTPSLYRRAVKDTEIRGVKVPEGASLVLRTDAANTDERSWKCPHQFDIDRPNVRQHATFGSGIHFCIGNALARRELVLTVETFLQRFSSIEIASDREQVRLIASFDFHALERLPLSLK